MFGPESLERPYKGYVVEGSAEPLSPHSNLWAAVASVLLKKPDSSVLRVDHYRDSILAYEDGDLAAWFGLGIAEISVDRYLPAPSYFLIPMDVGRAVAILRRAVEDYHEREIRKPALYEALSFLGEFLGEKKWLARRYQNALRGDTRNQREKMQQREQFRIRFRGIQQACAEIIVAEMNERALHFRENRATIDELRRQLAVVNRPMKH